MNVKLTTFKEFVFLLAVLANLADVVVTYNSNCPPLRLVNGRSRYRWRRRNVQFNCIRGFQLVGAKYATCINGKWDVSVPICVRYGCRAPSMTHVNGQFLESYRGAVVKIVCNAGYTLVGSPSVYCNGIRWNETFPVCKVTNLNPSSSCDFEDSDMCGWNQDPMHDFDWMRRKAPIFAGNFSPSFDHTPGQNGSGSYMYIDVNVYRKENYTARLYSPVYPYERSYSSCFKFWYYISGSLAGSFKVYVKPEGVELFDLIPSFWINQGETKKWLLGFFTIEPMETPFQIVIEGVQGHNFSSTIAFDDVTLATGDDCIVPEEMTSTTETTTSVNPDDSSGDFPSCKNLCNVSVESASKSFTVSDVADWPGDGRCSCQEGCVRDGNCCPDFFDFCSVSASTTTAKPEVESSTTSLTSSTTTTTATTQKVEERTEPKVYQDFNNETNEIDPKNPILDWRPRDNGTNAKGKEDVVVVTTTRKSVSVEKGVAKVTGKNETVELGVIGSVNVTKSVSKESNKTETIARSKAFAKVTKNDRVPERKSEMNSTKLVIIGGGVGSNVNVIQPRKNGTTARKSKGNEVAMKKTNSTTSRPSSSSTTSTTTTRTTTTSTTSSSSATTPARVYKQLKPNNIKLTFPEKPSRSNVLNETPFHKGKPKELSGKELPQAIKRKNDGSKEAAFRGILEIAGTSLAVLIVVILGVVWYRRSKNRKTERDSMVEDSDSILYQMDSSSSLGSESHSLICIRPGGLGQSL